MNVINWIKKKLGIIALENVIDSHDEAIGRIDKYLGLQSRAGNHSQRYDQIERARKRRYKA